MPLKKPSSLLRCDRGAVAIIIALVMIPLIIAAGVAIDLSRAYLVKQRLARAVDAAGLAVGAAVGTGQDLQAIADSYFTANFPPQALGTAASPVLVVTSSTVSISATATLNTSFMRIAGINSISVNSSAEITRKTEGLEVALVLDNTGSMDSGGKLDALKTASHDLIDILFGAEVNPPLLKVGLVPFAGSVNIGTANAAWTTGTGALDWGTTSWGGCVSARAYPGDVQDTDTATGGAWAPFYWSDHNDYNNWVRSWGYSISAGPPSTRGPNKYCTLPITPLTNDRVTLTDQINAMWAEGYTHVNIGAVWGWRVISPGEPFSEGVAYGTADWNKAVIILTDGQNTTSNSVFTAYGYRSDGTLGSTSSSGTQAALDSRLAEICTAMKLQNIQVYTITFQLSDPDTQTLFQNCASAPENYFNSPSNEALKQAFRAIGAKLRKLHLSK